MGLLANTYIFYADVYFIQNFIIKSAVLMLIVFSFKRIHHASILRIIAIAVGGTIFEIVGLILIPNYTIFLVLVNFFEIPIMMLCLVIKQIKVIVKSSLLGYLYVILINGTLEALGNILGGIGHFISLLLFSCIIVIVGTFYVLYQKKIKKGIYSVKIEQEGTKLCVLAYYDSGNCLKDPYTGKGVHIISNKLTGQMLLREDNKVCIPYKSLGNEAGLLDVFYIEKIEIYSETEKIELHKIPLGIAKEDLFKGKQYEMILNEEIW